MIQYDESGRPLSLAEIVARNPPELIRRNDMTNAQTISAFLNFHSGQNGRATLISDGLHLWSNNQLIARHLPTEARDPDNLVVLLRRTEECSGETQQDHLGLVLHGMRDIENSELLTVPNVHTSKAAILRVVDGQIDMRRERTRRGVNPTTNLCRWAGHLRTKDRLESLPDFEPAPESIEQV